MRSQKDGTELPELCASRWGAARVRGLVLASQWDAIQLAAQVKVSAFQDAPARQVAGQVPDVSALRTVVVVAPL